MSVLSSAKMYQFAFRRRFGFRRGSEQWQFGKHRHIDRRARLISQPLLCLFDISFGSNFGGRE